MEIRALIVFFLAVFASYCLGVLGGMNFKDKQAVAVGVAHWVVDTEGKVNLEYNK